MLSRVPQQHTKPERIAISRISGFDYALATSVNPWGITAT
jgi:hypothetical protein